MLDEFCVESTFEKNGVKFFIISYKNKYGCFFDGIETFVNFFKSIEEAKVYALILYDMYAEFIGKNDQQKQNNLADCS